mmetsp:Transcript_17561/g.40457  ORF Transcript_17561/g.40457 Transcript_17561/m.40457 type:complete len:174 (-) Transcript_17561:293-814(-)
MASPTTAVQKTEAEKKDIKWTDARIRWPEDGDPSNDDDEEEETKKDGSKEKETAANNQEAHLAFEDDELDELEPQEAYVRQMERTVEKSRTILEMNWQIENCVVDSDACTDFCTECAGSGKTWCKFCRGTGMIAFGNEFRSCMLCENGRVDCSACAGTGMISPWAKTHDNGTL